MVSATSDEVLLSSNTTATRMNKEQLNNEISINIMISPAWWLSGGTMDTESCRLNSHARQLLLKTHQRVENLLWRPLQMPKALFVIILLIYVEMQSVKKKDAWGSSKYSPLIEFADHWCSKLR